MSIDPAISVVGLHEVFKIYDEAPPGIKERLTSFRRSSFREFHALNGVTLDIMPGERVGLIGHNGSGKSTLLKCMAGILPADQGSVEVNGRLATLLELGAGFSPELTGRENMYLNGSILGLSRAEVDDSFDDIVDFAGIRDFIDHPVKNYSSGMYVRLGFAIAVNVDPDILLVDEVLAVGDQTFQERSLSRMKAFAEAGKTVVLVSHDLGSIEALCDRGILLESGQIAFDGPVSQALEEYQRRLSGGHGADMHIPDMVAHEVEAQEEIDPLTHAIDITAVHLSFPDTTVDEHSDRDRTSTALPDSEADAAAVTAAVPVDDHPVGARVDTGTTARLTVTAAPTRELIGDGGLYVRMTLRRPDLAKPLYDSRTSYRVQYLAPPPVGRAFVASVDFALNVLSGTYLIDLEIGNAETDEVHARAPEAARVVVRGEPWDVGVVPLDLTFTIDNPAGVWPPESEPPGVEDGGPAAHPDPLWPSGATPPTARP